MREILVRLLRNAGILDKAMPLDPPPLKHMRETDEEYVARVLSDNGPDTAARAAKSRAKHSDLPQDVRADYLLNTARESLKKQASPGFFEALINCLKWQTHAQTGRTLWQVNSGTGQRRILRTVQSSKFHGPASAEEIQWISDGPRGGYIRNDASDYYYFKEAKPAATPLGAAPPPPP